MSHWIKHTRFFRLVLAVLMATLLGCASDAQNQQDTTQSEVNGSGDNASYEDGEQNQSEASAEGSDEYGDVEEQIDDFAAADDQNGDYSYDNVDSGANYGNGLGQGYDSEGQASPDYGIGLNNLTNGNLANSVLPSEGELAEMEPQSPGESQPTSDQVGSTTPIAGNLVENIPEVPVFIASLKWIGFAYDQAKKQVKIEMVTRGSPEFEIAKEKNLAGQPELVIRYLNTQPKQQIARDLDASEFRSPVAYVRVRYDEVSQFTDVILTLRDQIKPKIYAKDGDVLLAYDIPERYLDVSFDKETDQKLPTKSIDLLAEADIMPVYADGSEHAKGYSKAPFIPDPAASQFGAAPDDGGTELQVGNNLVDNVLSTDLPDSFSNESKGQYDVKYDQGNQGNQGYQGADPAGDGDGYDGYGGDGGQDEDGYEYPDMDSAEGQIFDSTQFLVVSYTVGAVAQDSGAVGNFGVNVGSDEFEADPGGNASGASGVDAANSYNYSGATSDSSFLQGATGYEVNENSLFKEESQAEYTELQGADTASTQSFAGKPISIEFHQAPLNLVLKSFAEESGNNFMYPETVASIPVTIFLKDVPWDEALKAILETYGLGMAQIGEKVVRVDTLTNITAYLQNMSKVAEFRAKLAKTKVMVLRLSHASATEIVPRIRTIMAPSIQADDRIAIEADSRTNSLVVEAPQASLEKVKALVERLDLETPQVEIASRIVEVSRNNSDFFGIVWASAFNYDPGRGLGFGSLNFPNSLTADFSVDPGTRGQSTSGNMGFTFGSINNMVNLDLILRMEEKRGTTNVLQSNKILVLDREKANISAGSSQYFRVPVASQVISTAGGTQAGGAGSGSGLESVSFNLSLEVTPEITADSAVIMDLGINTNSPSDAVGDSLAAANTRSLNTKLIRRSGDTAVIGGIYDNKKQKTVIGIPFLSDIPIIGALFRSTGTTETQMEMMVMVTPTIQTSKSASGDLDALPESLPSVPEPVGTPPAGDYSAAAYEEQSSDYEQSNQQAPSDAAEYSYGAANYQSESGSQQDGDSPAGSESGDEPSPNAEQGSDQGNSADYGNYYGY